jgi:hypothetical protein
MFQIEDITPITGFVYKIVSDSTDNVYIGSTSNTVKKRFGQHKLDYKRYARGKHSYTSSFDIIKYGDARIEILAEIYDGEDIKAVEQYYIDNTPNCININRAMKRDEIHHCDVCNVDIKLGVCKKTGWVVNSNALRHEKSARHLRNLAASTV